MHTPRRRCAWAAFTLCSTVSALAQTEPRLGELSLEDLGNLQITSVSKRAERLSDAPTSVFVITAADIRRAGSTSLPEALRLAPNLHVARSSASEYVVSARGFAGNSANKMLVLVDGRSVYTPLYSGVFWDVQDLMLEDVDRIEVISGPGSTLWGTNAVNGVINIITRDAASTAGNLATASAGTDGSRINLRHGVSNEGGIAWRLYAMHTDLRNTETADGTRVDDAGHHTQVGFRADEQRGADRFMLRGNAYRGSRGQPGNGQMPLGRLTVSGAHVLGLWERRLDSGRAFQLQAYVDHTERTAVPTFGDTLDTLDLQFQHSPATIANHNLVWGVQYRTAWDQVDNSSYLAFLPARKQQTWASLFAQDDITLSDTLRLTLGARAEHNDYTGTEFLPTVRLAWKLAPQQLLWTAASRTVRAPSRLDRDFYYPGNPPYQLQGGPNFDSEVANVAEVGYRGQPTPTTSLSATVYHADYDRLRTVQFDPIGRVYELANGMKGRARGLELWGSFQALPSWRLHAGYSRLWQDLWLKPGSNDVGTVAATEGASPSHWWTLRSSHDLGGQVELDFVLRHVAALAAPAVPRYTALDMRLAWRPNAMLEVALAGQNLTGNGHGEFGDVTGRTQLQRALFAQLSWRF